jgi:hypothetical protein
MRLPFTADEFLGVFERYNAAVWPAQWLLLAVALVALVMVIRSPGHAWRGVAAFLALLSAWTAVAYHFLFFTRLTPGAWLFGGAFLVQAALLAASAFGARHVRFAGRNDRSPGTHLAGWAIVVYALAVYPMVSMMLGHEYPRSPTFGLPCPTVLLTLGVLVLALPTAPWWLFVVPTLWAMVGTSAALQLGMREDFALPVAAAAAIALLLRGRARARHGGDGGHPRPAAHSRPMASRKMRA